MRSSIWAIALLLTAFSGCAGDAPSADLDGQDDHDDHDHGDHDHGNGTDVPAVEALLSADVVNGTAPLLVNFTVEAGPDATWGLDFGDGNSTTGQGPGLVAHTYEQVGAFNATLTVGNATRSISVDVEAGTLPSGTVLDTTNWTEDGRLIIGLTAECGVEDGVDRAEHTWANAGLLEADYQIANILLVIDEEDTAIDIDLDLLDADGNNIGSSHSFNPLAGPGETITAAGPYAPGDFTVVVTACTGADLGYELTVTADLVAA